jgi:hypothetical protein
MSRYKLTPEQRRYADLKVKPTYSAEDFAQIAVALGVSVDDVSQHVGEFEAAARWYRLNVPPQDRQEGPTSELRKQRIKKVKDSSGGRKRRTEKPRTLFALRKKAEGVEAAARKLLLHLGIRRLRDAPDGPQDRELLTFLATYSGSSEEKIIGAAARIGRLAELLEAIDATNVLATRANKAAKEAVRFAEIFPKGHQGDVAVIGWIDDMMDLWRTIKGAEPGFSAQDERRPGPFLRFVQAAGKPLEIDFSPDSVRSRQRALKRSVRPRQK